MTPKICAPQDAQQEWQNANWNSFPLRFQADWEPRLEDTPCEGMAFVGISWRLGTPRLVSDLKSLELALQRSRTGFRLEVVGRGW